MNFSSLFGSKPQSPAQTAQATATPSTPGAGNPGNIPNPAEVKPAENTPQSPLAEHAKLWENDPNTKPQEPIFNLNPENLAKSVASMDFTKSITQDQMKAIAAGGQDAIAAMQQMLNSVGREVFAQASVVATQVAEHAATKTASQAVSAIPGIVKQQTTAAAILAENPALANPAVAPIVDALQQQFRVKYPNATAEELRTHTYQYLNGFADMIKQPQLEAAKAAEQAKTAGQDFFTLLGVPSGT